MSKEFFETMDRIEQLAKKIKFLEGTHPELYSNHSTEAMVIDTLMLQLDEEITIELKKKALNNKAIKPTKKRARNEKDK